jgi:asparagine synthase (glutamine-hydrolysing)
MCRIAGILSNKLTGHETYEKVRLMCGALQHGGPDDEGIFHDGETGLVLGHRRLSIIDLSSKGHQPMADVQGKAWIIFNGEIYNYLELKKELLVAGAKFQSDTDTEVIIQAFLHWGVSSFSKLRGMFAFALYDVIKKTTYLVRDTTGIKPLYYYISNGQLSFASEVKALKEADIANEPENNWPIQLLAFGNIPEPYTTLKNVFSLPKGNFLRWEHQSSNYAIKPYKVNSLRGMITNKDEAQQLVREQLGQAITRQLIADAPIGVFLSGGIDSSLISLISAQKKQGSLKTVSIYFDEKTYDESSYQNIIHKKIQGERFCHLVKEQDFSRHFPEVMQAMDMPTTDGINSWFICKYAHQDGLKSVLSGIGADELFGGYPSFNRIKRLKLLKQLPDFVCYSLKKLAAAKYKRAEYLNYDHPLAEYLFLRGLLTPSEIAKILDTTEEFVAKVLFNDDSGFENMADNKLKAAWFETNLYMQNQLLRDTDVMSMAHGLEVRVPFLDEDLQQLISLISPEIRFSDAQPKNLLIDSFKNILPEEIWNRPKMGFSFPLQQWMANHEDITDSSYFKSKVAQKIIRDFKGNSSHWSKAFALYQIRSHV